MANIRDIGNEDIQARTSSELLVSVLGLNNTTQEVDVYTLLVTTKEPITGLSLDNFSSGNYAVTYVKAASGDNVGTVVLDEEDPTGDVSLAFAEDYNYINNNAYGFSRNTLVAMLTGQTFKMGDDIITVVGTNGTNKTDRKKARASEMNLPFASLLKTEGGALRITKGVKDGKATYKSNPFINAFNLVTKTVALEFRTVSGSGKQNTILLPYVDINSVTRDEGDTNSYSITGQKICDSWERPDYFTESALFGLTELKTEIVPEIGVDYVVVDGATEPAEAPTGATAVIVATDGTISFKKKDTAWTAVADALGKLAVNGRILAKTLVTKTPSATIACNTFVVKGKDGKAVDFGGKKYCKVYNYNRETQEFEEYQS